MFVTSVSIRREGYYGGSYGKADASKPFHATIEVHGRQGKVELNLSTDMSARIIDLIADEVAAAGRATAEALVANVLEAKAAPQIEQAA